MFEPLDVLGTVEDIEEKFDIIIIMNSIDCLQKFEDNLDKLFDNKYRFEDYSVCDILSRIEKKFDIEIGEDDFVFVNTVEDILSYAHD